MTEHIKGVLMADLDEERRKIIEKEVEAYI